MRNGPSPSQLRIPMTPPRPWAHSSTPSSTRVTLGSPPPVASPALRNRRHRARLASPERPSRRMVLPLKTCSCRLGHGWCSRSRCDWAPPAELAVRASTRSMQTTSEWVSNPCPEKAPWLTTSLPTSRTAVREFWISLRIERPRRWSIQGRTPWTGWSSRTTRIQL